MNKRLIDILLLRKLDRYLLKNHPAVWQTKGHYMLINSLLINIPLFLIGYLITNTNNLTVPPIRQLFLEYDSTFLTGFLITILFIFLWIFTQYEKASIKKSTSILIHLIVYITCLSSILLLNTSSYRLGTICKSKKLMNLEDVSILKKNHFYRYGLVIISKKEFFNKEINYNNNFFKMVRKNEDSILYNRYNLKYLLSKRSLSFSYLASPSVSSSLMLLDDYMLNRKISPAGGFRDYEDRNWDILRKKINFFVKKSDSIESLLPNKILAKYDIERVCEKIYDYKGIALKDYPHLFDLEDIAFSSLHSKQYLKEKIWFKNTNMLIPFVLIFSLVLSSISYYKLEQLMIGLLLIIIGLFIYQNFFNSSFTQFSHYDEIRKFLLQKKMENNLKFNYLHSIFIIFTLCQCIFSFANFKIIFFYYPLLVIGMLISAIMLFTTGISLQGLNFALNENNCQLYSIPFACAFVGLFAMWFIHQKPWAR